MTHKKHSWDDMQNIWSPVCLLWIRFVWCCCLIFQRRAQIYTWKSEDTTDVWGIILHTSLWSSLGRTHSNRERSRRVDIPKNGGKQPFVQSVCTHALMTGRCGCGKYNFSWQLTAVSRVEERAESVYETPPAELVWVRHTKGCAECEWAQTAAGIQLVTVYSRRYRRLVVNITVKL